MARCARIVFLFALLGVLVLVPALGCSFSKSVSIGNVTPDSTEAATVAAPVATATTPAETATPEPTEAPAAPSPTPSATSEVSASQTITQNIVMHNVGSDGTISYESSFTMTASIQVGTVDGIEYTADSVPMPQGAATYDPTNPPAIGDAVEQADSVIVQVLGVATVDVDADNEFVLVDVVVGNNGEERQLVATDPCMEIVSGDGHWYSPFWYTMYWAGTGGSDYMTAQAAKLQQEMVDNGITTYFSAPLEPGEAARGTAAFLVPKSAKQLAFGFQTWLGATYLMFGNEAEPTVLVPLGLHGDFPALPTGADALEPGATYEVGDSFTAPERGVALQVESAWARQEAMGAGREVGPDEEFVMVHLLAPALGERPLDPVQELALVGPGGEQYELQEYTTDWLTSKVGPYNQRGVLVFKGPRETSGLTLELNPLDPATMDGDSPEPLADEAVAIDLGDIPVAEPVMQATGTPAEEGETTPTPAGVSGSAHDLGDQVVVDGLAITPSGWGTESGPEDFAAREGQTWLLVQVTVENMGNEDAEVDPERFAFVDTTGAIHNELWNAPSVWDEISADVLGFGYLAPRDSLQDKLLVTQIDEAALTGLRLRYSTGEGNEVLWDLGL